MSPAPEPSERLARAILAALTLAFAAARLWLAARLPLAPDEAYYWTWSGDLSLSYPDHPPLVAWMIRAGTAVAGASALGVRLAFALAALGAIPLLYGLAKEAGLSPLRAAAAAGLGFALPAPAAGALFATPDAPLGLCWLGATLCAARLARSPSTAAWYGLGLAAGLAVLSKHAGLLVPAAAVGAACLIPRVRGDLRTKRPWLAALIAIAVASPYAIAETRAGLPSVSLQLAHLSGSLGAWGGGEAPGLAERTGGLLAGQIGLATPLVLLWAAAAIPRLRKSPAALAATIGYAIPAGATLAVSLLAHPEQSWASLGHPGLAVVAVWGICERARPAAARAWMAAAIALAIAPTAIAHAHALRPFLPLPPERDPVTRLHGWHEAPDLVREASDPDAVLCDNYGLAAEMSWHLRNDEGAPPVLSADRAGEPPPGRWLLIDERADWGGASLPDLCESTRSFGTRILRREDGAKARELEALVGEGCRARRASEQRLAAPPSDGL